MTFSQERRVSVTIEYRLRANTEAGLDKAQQDLLQACQRDSIRSFPTGIFQTDYECLGYVEGHWPELSITMSVDGEKEVKYPTWREIQKQIISIKGTQKAISLQRNPENGRAILPGELITLVIGSTSDPELMTMGVECAHGWRNLLTSTQNTESKTLDLVIGGQRANYPSAGCIETRHAIEVAYIFVMSGTLKSSSTLSWDNPPKE